MQDTTVNVDTLAWYKTYGDVIIIMLHVYTFLPEN